MRGVRTGRLAMGRHGRAARACSIRWENGTVPTYLLVAILVILAPVGHSPQAACLTLHAWAAVEAHVWSPAKGPALAWGLWGPATQRPVACQRGQRTPSGRGPGSSQSGTLSLLRSMLDTALPWTPVQATCPFLRRLFCPLCLSLLPTPPSVAQCLQGILRWTMP